MPLHPIPDVDSLIQAATVLKPSGSSLKHTFRTPFKKPPLIFTQAYWKGANSNVGTVETVSSVSLTDCTVVSGSSAANYFVNILALDQSLTGFDTLAFESGNQPKPKALVTINFLGGRLKAPDPALLLTAILPGTASASSPVETVLNSSAGECRIAGATSANHSVNYLAADPGVASIGKRSMMAGVVNKTGGGLMRVYFPKPFESAPAVFLTPWWDKAAGSVGAIETLSAVEKEYFEFFSSNYSVNFYVNWIAVSCTPA